MTTNLTNKRAKRGSKHSIKYFVVINQSDPIAEFKTHKKALSFVSNNANLTKYNLHADAVIKIIKEKYSIDTVSQHQVKPYTALAAVDLGLE
jgi:hypothetical protein